MLTKTNLEKWYLVDHLTMQQIADKVGCTRQNVHYSMRRLGVGSESGERFKAKCDVCGRDYEVTRARFKKSVGHYCGKDCYKEYLRSKPNRDRLDRRRIAISEIVAAGRVVPEGFKVL